MKKINKKIIKVELMDSENNKWWILLNDDTVLSVMFRIKEKTKISYRRPK